MTVEQLLHNVEVLQSQGDLGLEIKLIVFDSRKANSEALYVAVVGSAVDGHDFISDAVANGCRAVVCETIPSNASDAVTYIRVSDSAKALGDIAANFYGHPSEKLKLIGVTGTNGKTSVSTLLFDVFKMLEKKSALISTVEYRIGDTVLPSTHTTPDIVRLNELLAQAVTEGCEYAFMEVSSHGIAQKRIAGLRFSIGGFTNITHDHLDYHKTFAEYLKVKKSFFDNLPTEAVAITNADDKNGNVMMQNTKAKRKTYALKTAADYQGKILEADFDGMLLNFNNRQVYTALTGKFNASNLLLVYAVASELGIDQTEVLTAISRLKRVKGRFETSRSSSGIYYIIDYAHTPDALENVLDSINAIRTKNERLICVFGCGGDRDREKRPEMGKLATRKATLAIVTSDNPRTEEPSKIIEEITAGIEPQYFSKYTTVPDRKEAMKMAIKFAEPRDIILVAGKGHEDYQEINGTKHPFDDRAVLEELLLLMGK